jgi:hypothetical protein
MGCGELGGLVVRLVVRSPHGPYPNAPIYIDFRSWCSLLELCNPTVFLVALPSLWASVSVWMDSDVGNILAKDELHPLRITNR